jgi:hypothetical protein
MMNMCDVSIPAGLNSASNFASEGSASKPAQQPRLNSRRVCCGGNSIVSVAIIRRTVNWSGASPFGELYHLRDAAEDLDHNLSFSDRWPHAGKDSRLPAPRQS